MKRIAFFIVFLTAFVIGRSQNEADVRLTAANSGGTYKMVHVVENGEKYVLNLYSENDTAGNYTDGPYNRWAVIDTGTGISSSTAGTFTGVEGYSAGTSSTGKY